MLHKKKEMHIPNIVVALVTSHNTFYSHQNPQDICKRIQLQGNLLSDEPSL